jgi:hypothetical protein
LLPAFRQLAVGLSVLLDKESHHSSLAGYASGAEISDEITDDGVLGVALMSVLGARHGKAPFLATLGTFLGAQYWSNLPAIAARER